MADLNPQKKKTGSNLSGFPAFEAAMKKLNAGGGKGGPQKSAKGYGERIKGGLRPRKKA